MDINNICYGCMREKVNNEEKCSNCGYITGSKRSEHYYLEEGTMINNRYLIGRVLGHGGFGITYIGFDTRLDIIVAIKEYLPSDVASRALGEKTVTTFSGDKREQFDYGLKRFLDEAKSLARYNQHPCIVSTCDFFEENNTAYLVMEYLDGIPLNEYLKRKGGKIPFEAALEIMMPIMDALREVHKSGMIHRDISPDNIYITSTGQIKLLDFGAARFALGEKSKSLSVILKPGFAPPEQYYTKGNQGPWTDVYSVAATIYRMILGENLPEAMERMLDDVINLPNELSSNVKNILNRALKVKHNERYKSIDELQRAIQGNKEQDIIKVENKETKTQRKKYEIVSMPVIKPQIQYSNDTWDEPEEEIKFKVAFNIVLKVVIIVIILLVVTMPLRAILFNNGL